ncbi:MAG TPA: flagellar basal body-associated FliL family protein [Gammaproteobacteria bacterium]|nr:flagellar basal body-associated FliL family protein [Gammaproteobacteria bacterium]
MAAKEPVRDDDDEDGDDKKKSKGAKKPAGPMKLVIVGAVAVFVAVLGAQVAAPLLTQMISGKGAAHQATGEEAADGEQAADEPADEEKPIELAAAEKAEPALYVPLDPPFVVSFEGANGETRFVQLTLQAMARNEKTIDAVKQHAPAIRNSFLFLISGYKVEDLATLKGKEKLRADMLVAANEIMEKNTGSAGIEELYFTSLVIQ